MILSGSSAPAEGARIVVGLSDILVDCRLDRYERMEHATLEPLFGEVREEALDGIQPRGRVGVKWKVKRGWRPSHSITLGCLCAA